MGEHLGPRLTADDRLEVTDHRGIRMRSDGRSEQVVRGAHVGHPIADRLVHRVFQRLRAALDAADLRAEQLHPEHVRRLTPHVQGPHVDDAFEAKEGTGGRRRDAVLARAGLRDHPMLPHPLREERLAHRAVDLVRAGVRQILAFQEDAPQPDRRREPRGVGERRGPADEVAQQPGELALEHRIGPRLEIGRLELDGRGHERLGQVLAAEFTEASRRHGRRAAANDRRSAPGSGARIRAAPTRTASTRAGSASISAGVAMPDSAISS